MVDLSYAYANARVKAMYSQLLDSDRMRAMLDVNSLPEFIELLEESPYKPSFVSASVRLAGIDLVKRALDDDLVASFRKILRIAPPQALSFLTHYVRGWEVSNLKKILAVKALGKTLSPDDLVILEPSSLRLFAPFLAARDLPEALKAFTGTEYSQAISRAMPEYEKTGDFRVFLSALESYHYGKIALLARGINDPSLASFLKLRLDVLNLMLVLRMKQSRTHPSDILKHLPPYANRSSYVRLVEAPSMEAALALASSRTRTPFPAEALSEAAAGKSLSGIEVALEHRVLGAARLTMRMSVLSLGTLVAYLHLKQEEVHALRKATYATQFDARTAIRKTILAA